MFGANQPEFCCENWFRLDESLRDSVQDRLALRFSIPFAAEATFRFSILGRPQKKKEKKILDPLPFSCLFELLG